ncbi:NAD(P)-binding domain-containing protein, partial [Nocardia sp. R6R-6]|uniref:NAD(P)-binding domain-containing protein n=1 Tax=Nocardia sp. R6R-6 TaxID=3459303 RepID=UPI00403D908D
MSTNSGVSEPETRADSYLEPYGATTGQPAAVASDWLEALQLALVSGTPDQIAGLFTSTGWWRDLLSFTWDLRTFHGRDALAGAVSLWPAVRELTGFRLPADGVPKAGNDDSGRATIESFIEFESPVAVGHGVVRLVHEDGSWRAWTLLTAVQELKGHEESLTNWQSLHEPQYTHVAVDRVPWARERAIAAEFGGSQPPILIIGAGQAGLTLSARLQRLGVRSLVVDRTDRLGNSWRNRYSNLQLHDTYWNNQLPYLPFPDTWPILSPKDKIADWLESYANHLDIPVWLSTRLTAASYDREQQRWTVELARGDEPPRTLHPRHLVMATGMQNAPFVPELRGRDSFAGEIYHSAEFPGGPRFTGRRAVVVGAGNSAHDVAQDLFEQGADTTMVQRSSTWVMSTTAGLPLLNDGYGPGESVEHADLWGASIPFPLSIRMSPGLAAHIASLDKELLDGLRSVGFKLNDEGPGRGITKAGGFYFDQGASRLLIEKKVALVSGDVVGFEPDAVVLDDGTELQADLVVLATGYRNMRDGIRELL